MNAVILLTFILGFSVGAFFMACWYSIGKKNKEIDNEHG